MQTTKKKRSFFTDIWRKIAALALALLLFFNLDKSAKMETIIRDVDIQVSLPSEEYVIKGFEPKTADIRVTTPKLTREPEKSGFALKYAVPVKKLEGDAKEIKVVLHDDIIEINGEYRGIHASLVSDEGRIGKELKIRLDRKTMKQVPVTVFKGSLEHKEYTAVTNIVDEESRMVVLYGPSEELMDISEVRTKILDFRGRETERKFTVTLELDDIELKEHGITIEGKRTVDVEVELVDSLKLDSYRFDEVPVSVLMPPQQDYAVFFTGIEQPKVNIVISGAPEVVHHYQKIKPVVCIDLRDVKKEGELNAAVQVLNLNDMGLKELHLSPKAFQIYVRKFPKNETPKSE